MSTTYSVTAGDTYDTIAMRVYGSAEESSRIARANPGVVQPLTPGTTITVPTSDLFTDHPSAKAAAPTAHENEVSLLIDGVRFRFWNSVSITRSIDSIDTIEFGTPFSSESSDLRDTFEPFTYKPVNVNIGGEPYFTGTMLTPMPSVQESSIYITALCYSLPGVLGDCNAPASAFQSDSDSLEFANQGLKEIATALAAPFGIKVKFEADPGAVFDQVALEPSKNVLSFLVDLAQQRNLVISSSPTGELVFLQSVTPGLAATLLRQGESPVLSIIADFDSQKYYSHITGIEPTSTFGDGSQFTAKNPWLEGVTRPLTFSIDDGESGEIKASVDAKLGRMFGNMATYTVKLAGWRDSAGEIWKPNTTVKLLAPGAMIYTEYEFVIRSVTLERDDVAETATLELAMPGSFSGKIPETLPWTSRTVPIPEIPELD